MFKKSYSIQATLCAITLFNHRRRGELERMKKTDLFSALNSGDISDPDVIKELEESES